MTAAMMVLDGGSAEPTPEVSLMGAPLSLLLLLLIVLC